MVTTEVTHAPRGITDLESLIIQRTLRVPRLGAEPGDSATIVRQLDSRITAHRPLGPGPGARRM